MSSLSSTIRAVTLSTFAATAMLFSACDKTDDPKPEPTPEPPITGVDGNSTVKYRLFVLESLTPHTGEVWNVLYTTDKEVDGGYTNSRNLGTITIKYAKNEDLIKPEEQPVGVGREYARYPANDRTFWAINGSDTTTFVPANENAVFDIAHKSGENITAERLRIIGNRYAEKLPTWKFRK